jgi:hypothetical protein
MKMAKATSAEDYKLLSSFEAVRKKLMDQRYADRLEKPLAYWALPNDRRLPLAFLGRSVGDLLATPFDELTATPGIGHKKICSLVKLLHRAIEDKPPAVPFGVNEFLEEDDNETIGGVLDASEFDPAMVSESMWGQWRETVRKHGLVTEKLGRLAPTLQALPTVIWHTPLSYYMTYTVSEIRQLKTHGEKRVRVVLEVFYQVHKLLSGISLDGHLVPRLAPKFVPPIDRWVTTKLVDLEAPAIEEVRRNLAVPLLKQIEIDAGPTVHRLVEGRLGVRGASQSVRMQSRKMGVTRARVYQLLDECSKIMQVRWPQGRGFLAELSAKLAEQSAGQDVIQLCDSLRELLFPEKHLSHEENGHE